MSNKRMPWELTVFSAPAPAMSSPTSMLLLSAMTSIVANPFTVPHCAVFAVAVIGGTAGMCGNVRTDDGVMGWSSMGCIRRMCFVSVVRRQNSLPQPNIWHLYGRRPECVRRCRASELVSAKALKHSVHTNGLSPVWTFRCTFSALRWIKRLSHPP